MSEFEAQDPNFAKRVRANFRQQRVMETFGAILTNITPGAVEIEMPFQETLTQQSGFLHAGIIATLLDSACGYAALTLMPPNAEVLSVEFKVNLLSPAVGDHMVAQAKVIRAGRNLTTCTADLFAASDMHDKLVATMLATMMAVQDGAGN